MPSNRTHPQRTFPHRPRRVMAGLLVPMGTLADKSLRQKRMQAHRTFNQLWEKGFMRKQDAYAWLCVRLGIPEADAHIANFSEYRCDQVILLCKDFLNAQRKVKQNGSKQHRVDR